MTDKPISKDLFLALLAMDSYNRGYGSGIGDAATSVAAITITAIALPSPVIHNLGA